MYFFFMLNWGLSGRIHFPRAPNFVWLMFQYKSSFIADKIFIADVSCRTGLLLTPKVTKVLGNCGYRVPRPLDAALGYITHADFARE